MKHSFSSLLVLISVSSALGCAGQADTSYRGEPLARFHGRVETAATTTTAQAPELSAALIWAQTAPNADAKVAIARPRVGSTVPVSGRFPAEFTLDVYEPPPESALFSCATEGSGAAGRMATASVRAIRRGAAPSSGDPFDFFGDVKDFRVVYVDADLPAESACPGGALSKGYHLFHRIEVAAPSCEGRAPDDPACRGPWPYAEVPLTTPLTLLIEPLSRDVQPPNGPSGPPTP